VFIRSRNVVVGNRLEDIVIHVEGETIARLLSPTDVAAKEILDFGSLVLAPGLVDPHVHINEPGRTEWEGFETATKAAAAGGVTTLVDMPLNSSPVTTTVDAFRKKLDAATGKLRVDVGFHAGLVPDNAASLAALLASGVLGVKAFLIHSGIEEFPNVAEQELRKAMPAIAAHRLPLLVHAELHGAHHESATGHPSSYPAYLSSRPRQWENDAIALMIRLCEEFDCRVHIVHVSSSEAVPMLRAAKAAGVPISAETCPHYLFLSSEEIPAGATQFKCAPPIRERENNEKLWHALAEGVIDFIASDHSPCPPEMKCSGTGDFTKAWGGISSLQFGLPLVWTAARSRGFQPAHVSAWMSSNPAKLVGLEKRKGKIAAGFDADFVLWNPDEAFVVEPSSIHHRHKLTPYLGRTLFGKVHATFVRGKKVFDRGNFSLPSGNVLLRN